MIQVLPLEFALKKNPKSKHNQIKRHLAAKRNSKTKEQSKTKAHILASCSYENFNERSSFYLFTCYIKLIPKFSPKHVNFYFFCPEEIKGHEGTWKGRAVSFRRRLPRARRHLLPSQPLQLKTRWKGCLSWSSSAWSCCSGRTGPGPCPCSCR